MDQLLYEKLCSKYKEYHQSNRFIAACFIMFEGDQPKTIRQFIEHTFTNNRLEDCTPDTFRRLSAHWNNVSRGKLELLDYKAHIYSAITSAKYRCVAKFLDSNG